MNKTDLVNEVATKAGMTKKDAERVINAFFAVVQDALKGGDKVQLIGFGTFETRDRKARKGRNPQTGEEIMIPARSVPVFRAGKSFKDSVEG